MIYMLKKIICTFAVFAIIFSFSACSSQSDDLYTAADGKQYILVRDSDGNIVINDSDKLNVYTLNENGKKQKSDAGEYITEYIEFNGQVVVSNKVETKEMRFTLPNDFSANEEFPGYFSYDEIDAEIFISYYNKDVSVGTSTAEYNCESLLESYGSEVFEYDAYTVEIDGNECQAYKQVCTSSEYYKNAFFCYIPYDTGYYEINCIVSTEYANRVNFDKFVKSFEIK